jgi:hypothetical protein
VTPAPDTRVLLDTTVVSELFRPIPHPGVIAFLRAVRGALLPVVVLHELEYGALRLPPGRKRDQLTRFVGGIADSFRGRVLELDPERAREAARLRAEAARAGRVLRLADALIAGTARAASLSLATRNVRDFAGLGIEVWNPWEDPWRGV